ncbi:hypothetical protein N3K66_000884 [Trichothecium roseum]|uniref:Uncharacterized protein n=1 Tax=Trichothecium roseum TaxID=47278 RepID=A0ACC0VF75_9HYPO|nr:hypothetical protein N3K66_000884 [Trichothecium roseum]
MSFLRLETATGSGALFSGRVDRLFMTLHIIWLTRLLSPKPVMWQTAWFGRRRTRIGLEHREPPPVGHSSLRCISKATSCLQAT